MPLYKIILLIQNDTKFFLQFISPWSDCPEASCVSKLIINAAVVDTWIGIFIDRELSRVRQNLSKCVWAGKEKSYNRMNERNFKVYCLFCFPLHFMVHPVHSTPNNRIIRKPFYDFRKNKQLLNNVKSHSNYSHSRMFPYNVSHVPRMITQRDKAFQKSSQRLLPLPRVNASCNMDGYHGGKPQLK